MEGSCLSRDSQEVERDRRGVWGQDSAFLERVPSSPLAQVGPVFSSHCSLVVLSMLAPQWMRSDEVEETAEPSAVQEHHQLGTKPLRETPDIQAIDAV